MLAHRARDGVVFGFTDHDRPLEFGGVTYEPEFGFAASEIRSGADLAVDAQEAEGVLTSDTITETDILDGRWDNAQVEVWRVNWSAVSQRVLMRRGAIGQVRRGRLAFVAEVRSLAHVLNQTVGRTFQHACDAELGDARCGVDLDDPAFRATGSVTALTGDRSFTASGLGGFAADWFALGRLTWTSGPNAGRAAEVASHVSRPASAGSRCSRRRCGRLRRATTSSCAPAATSGWRPAATGSPTSRTSAASRTSPARTR